MPLPPDGVLRVRSFAKVNLALSVLRRRADGYHEIRTVYQSISLADDLEFHPCTELRLDCDDLPGVAPENNLVWKAAVALAAIGAVEPRTRIVLHKNIPSGAGLGGGSANAAATLLGLSRLWNLAVGPAELLAIAADLGSDVPFFLHGGTVLGVGRGEEIYPLPEIIPAHLVVIYPGIQVPTAQAYKSLSLGLTSPRHPHKIQRFCGMLRAGEDAAAAVFNDFEASILPAYPAVREAKSSLDQCGATATLLSGSGSSVFGFFVNEESALAASRAVNRETWRVFPAKTLSSAEYFHRMFGVGAGR
jgi:4-diphosphocytidyl-2-C-methyl-D-erythritol kinase